MLKVVTANGDICEYCPFDSINKDKSQVDTGPSPRSLNAKYIEITERRIIISEPRQLKWAVVDSFWDIQAIFLWQADAEIFLKNQAYYKIVEIID